MVNYLGIKLPRVVIRTVEIFCAGIHACNRNCKGRTRCRRSVGKSKAIRHFEMDIFGDFKLV